MVELFGEDYLEDEGRAKHDIITITSRFLRICQGWFFPEVNEGEPAIYWDYYFLKSDSVVSMILELDFNSNSDKALQSKMCEIDIGT